MALTKEPGIPSGTARQQERDRIRAQVAESRRRQGLPPTIEDPVILAKVAALIIDALDPVDLPTPDSNGEVPPIPSTAQ